MSTNKKIVLIVIVLLVASCGILMIIGSLLPEGEPRPTRTPKPTVTDRPTDIPTATLTPEPTPVPLSPEEQFVADVIRVLGKGNRDVDRVEIVDYDPEVTIVRWAINDNLTENMIKRGLMMDIAKLMEVAANSGLPYDELMLMGTFSMVDQYGNVEEALVSSYKISQDEVNKINWDNFLTDNVARLGYWWLHPAFED
jgi:hypothetical protein